MKKGLSVKSLLLILVLIMALTGVGIAYALTVHTLPQAQLSAPQGWMTVTKAQFEEGVSNQTDISGWPYRKPVTITNSGGTALTDYQVRVDVVYNSHMQNDFDDIRFVNSAGNSLSYWRESYTASTSAVFWVKVPSIPTGSSTIYMYYGNESASSTSNGTATFVFFDDFESGNLDKWTLVTDTFWTIATDQKHSGTYSLKAGSTSSSNKYIAAKGVNEANLVWDSWWYATATSPDISSCFRASDTYPYNDYEINWEGHWTIAEHVNGLVNGSGWISHGSVSGTLPTNTWFKTTIIIKGSPGQMKFLLNDVQINPASGWVNVGTNHASGTVALRAWSANNNWWIDDVRARKYVDPEPTTTVGAEEVLSLGKVELGIASYTTTYDFSAMDRWASAVDSNNAPPTSVNSETWATPDEYSLIAASDDVRWQLPDPGGGDYEWIKSQMTIKENVAAITRIDFTGEAYGSRSGTARIYAYNIATSSWNLVGSGAVGNSPPDATITGSITSGFSNYIDANGHLTWAFGLTSSTSEYLYVDYVKVVINSTTTYNFSTVDRWASAVDSNNDPPTSVNSETWATPDEYSRIAASDNVRWQLPDPGGGDYEWIKSQMTIKENVAAITRIDFTGEAYGSVSGTAKIYAYNIATSSWNLVGSGTVPNSPPDATITGSITSNFNNYIDANGHLIWAFGLADTSDYLYVDYVKVEVTYTAGYYSSGTIASEVYDTGKAGASWDGLGSSKTLPTGTSITFQVRASDTAFAKDNATLAWQAASALPITGRYQQWRATLTTSDTSKTPILHEVRVLYSS
jgi:hypothetical protein